MQKLEAITAFLLNLNMVAAEQLESWTENIRFHGVCKDLGNNGMVLFRIEYNAVIAIERFNHKRMQPELLFAHVIAWLLNNDDERDDLGLEPPDTDVDILDNDNADIEISIPFIEDVQIIQDDNGPIEIDGVKYILDLVPIDYAETGDVTTDG